MGNTKQERKIIGYKAPIDLYGGQVSQGRMFVVCVNDNFYELENSFGGGDISLPKEIVEQWEPVYEEISKDQVFTLGCSSGVFELKVTPNGIFYEPENSKLDYILLSKILNISGVNDGRYTYLQVLEHVDLGCKKRVPVDDIKAVLDYYKKIKK